MDDIYFETIEQINNFLNGSQKLILRIEKVEDKYNFIQQTVNNFDYLNMNRKDRKTIIKYLRKITGYKHTQIFRLINKSIYGDLKKKQYKRKSGYHRLYTVTDIKLLEKTDELHLKLNSNATSAILKREYELFHHDEYKNISRVSKSHIDNLRKSNVYINTWVNPTKPNVVNIGTTAKPEHNNNPGSIRIDAVHQRDIFHINAVDEIIQWEVIVCVPQISELYLLPALNILLDQFPFVIFNFHSDRGSEFINDVVAKLLKKLLVKQTKSRSRHCNDNALVETKNGSIVRKNMGYWYMNKEIVTELNKFYLEYFNTYLNYHRPCGYVTEIETDFKGRERKIYGQYTTPYEKLKEVSGLSKQSYLKANTTFEKLDEIAYDMSDNEYAKLIRKRQNELFESNIFFNRGG